MRKLGLLPFFKFTADNLDRYAKLFTEGLSEEQVRMIQDLFMQHVPESEPEPEPEPEEAVVDEEA
jgi:hypothetical protein